MEREAMEFACELIHPSKAFHNMVCTRLEVICHEDLDTIAAPARRPLRRDRVGASRGCYSNSIGEARLMAGDPHDGARAEVPRGLPLRCRHRASMLA
jgi:hypothetical protein